MIRKRIKNEIRVRRFKSFLRYTRLCVLIKLSPENVRFVSECAFFNPDLSIIQSHEVCLFI